MYRGQICNLEKNSCYLRDLKQAMIYLDLFLQKILKIVHVFVSKAKGPQIQ